MIITTAKLRKWSACKSGLEWFISAFPDGCNLSERKDVEKWLSRDKPGDLETRLERKEWLVYTLIILCIVYRDYNYCRCNGSLKKIGINLYDYVVRRPSRFYDSVENLHRALNWLSYKRLTECTLQVSDMVKR